MKTQYDVCVVGGGAAGMAAAIAAAEGGNTVCIIDKNKKLGKKLYATGNGRCNLANTDMKDGHYHLQKRIRNFCIPVWASNHCMKCLHFCILLVYIQDVSMDIIIRYQCRHQRLYGHF